MLVSSTSDDINILMLFLLHQFKNKRVLIDNGTSNRRKIIDTNSTTEASTSRRSCKILKFNKLKFLDVLIEHERFVQTFSDLGLFGYVMTETKQKFEYFLCLIYGGKKCKSVDKQNLLHQKFEKQRTVQLIML